MCGLRVLPNSVFTAALLTAPGLALAQTAAPVTSLSKELSPRLSPEIPADFFSPAAAHQRTLFRLQHDFDIYSWETFVALNWPTNDTGAGKGSVMIGDTPTGDHPTVWEGWKSTGDLFLSDGREPKAWGRNEVITALLPRKTLQADASPAEKCEFENVVDLDKEINDMSNPNGQKVTLRYIQEHPREYRFITKLAKGHSWFAAEQPFDTGPLIDQAGNYARFEILMNESAYTYVRGNELYHISGQEAFFAASPKRHVVFPIGRFQRDKSGELKVDFEGRPKNGATGAIIVKAAWKPLTSQEINGARFHSRKTLVYTPKDVVNGVEHAEFQLITLGLVGLHIVHKSEDVAQWNWSTFEHIDNCPDFADRARHWLLTGRRSSTAFTTPNDTTPMGRAPTQLSTSRSRVRGTPWQQRRSSTVLKSCA